MIATEVKTRIKEIVFEATNVKPEEIADTTAFVGDLGFDSLTMLEIAVNIDQEYGLDLTEDEMTMITSVNAAINLIMDRNAVTA